MQEATVYSSTYRCNFTSARVSVFFQMSNNIQCFSPCLHTWVTATENKDLWHRVHYKHPFVIERGAWKRHLRQHQKHSGLSYISIHQKLRNEGKSLDSSLSYFSDTSNMLSFTPKHRCLAGFIPGSFHVWRGVGVYRDNARSEVRQELVRFFTLCFPVLDRVGAQCRIQLDSLVWGHETIFLGDHNHNMQSRGHKQSHKQEATPKQ